jgi:acyl-coenzyme A synthetase/AMP-(fatty) acid ligase
LANVSPVRHAHGDADTVIQRYVQAFLDQESIVIVSAARLDLVRAHPDLGGWWVTDCATTFERLGQGEPPPTTPELIIETSGTTGDPKMVRYRKDVIRDCATTIADNLPLRSERDYVSLVNPRLAYGLSIVHSHLLADVPVTFRPAPAHLNAWAELRESLRPETSVYLLPHQSYLLAQDESWSFGGALELIFAGGKLTEAMIANLKPTFPNATIVNMYGQAELGPRISMGRSAIAEFAEGNVGRPLPGVDIRITPEDGVSDPAGNIEVNSPFQMSSYFRVTGAPAATEQPADWWQTGDIGYRAQNGDLWVAGRAAPDINFLGSRVQVDQLRGLVREVPGVLDARVSAVDHRIYGQQPAIRALTETVDDGAERRIRRALAGAMGSSATAVLITVIDLASLPESGKL